MNLPINQPNPTDLIAHSLNTLSSDLHNQLNQKLQQATEQQQAQLNQTLSELMPMLLEQLLPLIKQEVTRQTETTLQQMQTCLTELRTTNQQQLKMLKLGREEYQLLQKKMTTTLTALDSMSQLDDSELQTSLKNLTTSIQQSNAEQTKLGKTLTKLETLSNTLQTQVTALENQQ